MRSFPLRTPPFDALGNWTKPYVDFFASLGANAAAAAGGSSGPVVTVTNVGNTFTPDLGAGNFQKIILVADSTLVAPIGTLANGTTTWTLIIDNPTAAQLTLTPDSFYFIGFLIAIAPNTRAQIIWTNDENDHNSVAGSAFNNPIPS